MNKNLIINLWLCCLAFAILLVSPARAAEGTATLRGQVSNRVTGDNLGGATVRVEGTDQVAYTERDGTFVLRNLAAGSVMVRVSFPGLDPATVRVDLLPGVTKQQDFTLTSEIYVLPEFAVSGSREATALAIARQEQSSTIMNSVSANAFGSIAQNNIANVLRRLPGVVGDINGVNVSSISVRGMDEQHTLVNIDGTAGAGATQLTEGVGEAVGSTGRASLPLGSVPAEFIESVEVVKTPTSDMDADSLGGVINLKTKSAFDRNGRTINLTAGATYNMTRRRHVDPSSGQYLFPSVQLVYGDVFNAFGREKNVGVFLTANHQQSGDTTGVTRVDPAANWDFQSPTLPERVAFPTSYQFLRNESSSLNLKLEYKLAKGSTVSVSGGYTNYKRPKDDMRPRLDGPGTDSRVPGIGPILAESSDKLWVFRNQRLEFLRQVVTKKVETWRWNVQGDHRLDAVHMTWDFSYSPSREDANWKATQNMTTAEPISFNWDRSDFAKPKFVQTGGRDITTNMMDNLTRIRAFGRDDIMTHDVLGARFDVAKRFDAFRIPIKLKTGLRFRQEDRDLDLNRFDSEAFARLGRDFSAYVDRKWTYDWPGGLPNVPMPDTERFFSDAGIRFVPQGAPHEPAMKFVYNPDYVVVNEANVIRDSNRDDWKTRDSISAVFLQGDFDLSRHLRMTAGMRYEKTAVELTKPVEDVRAPTVVERWTQRRTIKSDYTNWFPNLQFRYEPWNRMVFRAAYSTTIGRPKITDISGRFVEDEVTQIVTFSNAALKPQEGRNIDLSVEYYFEPVGVVSVGVFRKKINNFIAPVTFRITGNEFGLDLNEFTGWEGRTKKNIGNGTVEGIEFNYSQQFTFLPRFLKGLGVFFNWTSLTSSGDFGELNPPPNFPIKNVLPKFRPNSGNLGLSWAYGRWDMRVMWNYTASYLEIPFLEGNLNRDRSLYRGEREQIDFFATFKVTPRIQIFADVLNIGPSNDSAFFGAVTPARQRDTIWMSTMLSTGIKASF
jgi:iron complex outermembrane recepter protein